MGPPLIILQLMMTVTFFMAITGLLGFACWWLGTRELTQKHDTHISTGSWTGFRIIIPNIILGVSVNSRNSRHRRRRHAWSPAAARRWWSEAGLAFVCQYYAKAQGGTHHRALACSSACQLRWIGDFFFAESSRWPRTKNRGAHKSIGQGEHSQRPQQPHSSTSITFLFAGPFNVLIWLPSARKTKMQDLLVVDMLIGDFCGNDQLGFG